MGEQANHAKVAKFDVCDRLPPRSHAVAKETDLLIGDKQEPSCKRCLKSNHLCIYTKKKQSFSFRHSRLSALVAAVDSAYERSPRWSPEQPPEELTLEPSPQDSLDSIVAEVSSPLSPGQTRYSAFAPSITSGRPVFSFDPNENVHHSPHTTLGNVSCSPGQDIPLAISPEGLTPSLHGHATQALTAVEGELLHFYVENIGPWVKLLGKSQSS